MPFAYPRAHVKVRLVDYPELSVLAVLGVSVKCLWSPEPDRSAVIVRTERVPLPMLDWTHWLSDVSAPKESQGPEPQAEKSSGFAASTVRDVLDMDAEQFDGYLRHVMTFLEDECKSSLAGRGITQGTQHC